MIIFFPLFFILFWSSAFISGKIIVQDASPFAALSFRFVIVAVGFFLYSFLRKEKIIAPFKDLFESISTGILFHGIYLGGCWYAFSIGMPGSIDLRYAKDVAKFIGSSHHSIEISEKDFLDSIDKVIYHIESYDITTVRASVGNYLVSK